MLDKLYKERGSFLKSKRKIVNGITLMIIPHSQKHVYRLHINYEHIFFALALFVAIFLFAGLSSAKNKNFDRQMSKESEKMLVWENRLWNFVHSSDKIEKQVLYLNAAGNSFHHTIWNRPYHENPVEEAEMSADSFYKVTLPLIRSLEFLIEREKAFSKMPLGWPIETGVVTSEFGARLSPFGLSADFHAGYDFANAIGTPVIATADGKVIFAGRSSSGYGKYVKVLHDNGFVSLYAHAAAIHVAEEDEVKRGDVIALLGQSGSATGPHVHYEVRLQYESGFELKLNPLPYITETP